VTVSTTGRPDSQQPDDAVQTEAGALRAALERKSLQDLASGLSNGSLAFQLQRLGELPLAAVVIEDRYSALYKLEHADGGWLCDQIARLQARCSFECCVRPTKTRQ
jgi:hypothetical protein